MTHRNVRLLAAGALLASATACADPFGSALPDTDLTPAFTTLPVGYNEVIHSYAGAENMAAFHFGPRGSSMIGLMGGGLNELYMGGNVSGGALGPGHGPRGGGHMGGPGFSHWPYADGRIDSSCTFNATLGRVVCPPVTRHGITVNKSVRYTTANGTVQPAFDTITTNTVNTQISAAGTMTRVSRRHNDSASVTVQHSSDRTVSGLARGSTQHTVNATSAGREQASGRDSVGAYTSLRLVADTTRNVVIPVTTVDSLRYPRSGTVIRQMAVTLTRTGQAATTSSRREVITYNGTRTATVVITRNGTTQTCTLPLPRGHLTCGG